MMLELFKPLQILKDKDNPVCFNEFGLKFSTNLETLSSDPNVNDLRPFVIFYDDTEHQYWYLKARGATKRDGRYKRQLEGEVKVRHSENGGYFYKDSYVDCSQIFKIDAELLESLVDKECWEYQHTLKLDNYDVYKILEEINDCCNRVPPYLSILEVKTDSSGKTYAESLYLSEEKINQILDDLDDRGQELNPSIDVEAYVSSPNADSQWNKERYDTGIEFVEKFQQEYFHSEWLDTNYQEKYYKPFKKQQEKEYER